MPRSILDAVAAAKTRVPTIDADDAADLVGRENVLFVDVRDSHEVAESGKIKGAINVSRGMLDFRADETTPLYDPIFTVDKTIVLYCGTGARAALCGVALQELGYEKVHNLGAFKVWTEQDYPTEAA